MAKSFYTLIADMDHKLGLEERARTKANEANADLFIKTGDREAAERLLINALHMLGKPVIHEGKLYQLDGVAGLTRLKVTKVEDAFWVSVPDMPADLVDEPHYSEVKENDAAALGLESIDRMAVS